MVSKLIRFFNSKGFAVFAFALMSVILFTHADHFYGYTGREKLGKNNIVSDGSGYYVYLPQYIVYPDSINYSFSKKIYESYPDANLFAMVSYNDSTKRVYSKFYVGTALLQSPFYFVTHKLHEWNGWRADGYERGYRLSIQIAAIFYWLIGVLSLFKFFERKGFGRFAILCGIALITFGTNLNFFTSFWVTMSHVYSFSMVALFVFLASLWAENDKKKHFLLMLFVLGLIAVIRPVNVLVILIVPFLFESLSSFWSRFKLLFSKKIVFTFLGLVLCALPVLVQLKVQFDQTGAFSLYTYSNEGFTNATNPQFWNVLFSYKKGFFVYAPAMFLIFIGLIYFISKERRYFVIGWFLTVFVWLYAISSWWCWDYGGSLGMRAMIEMLPLLLIPIMFVFKAGNKLIPLLSVVFMIVGSFFYQRFQTQFNSEIIDCCVMTKHDYWNVFLKTDERHRWMVAYEQMREKLDDNKKKDIDVIAEFNSGAWKVKKDKGPRRLEPVIYENLPILIYHNDSLASRIKGRISGQIKLDDPKCNPFVSVRYLNTQNLVEESIFTIGSNIEKPFEFEQFEVDINHVLKGKNIRRIEFVISLGGCTPAFKHVKFVKYE